MRLPWDQTRSSSYGHFAELFSINLIKAITIKVKRLKAALDEDYLLKVLTS